MSEKNEKNEARILLKKICDFNVAQNYYQTDLKNELARDFKSLLFIDEPTVRKMLEKLFSLTIKATAQEFDLLGSESEVEKADAEEPEEEKIADKENTEEQEAQETTDNTETKEEKPEEETNNEESSTNPDQPPEEQSTEEVPKLESYTIRESYISRVNDLLL